MRQAPKEPCKECPFLRGSAPGYLGASTPEEFMQQVRTEHSMPCHMTVDYEDAGWQEQLETTAKRCRGSLVFLKNNCKLPREPDYSAAVQETTANRTAVFSNAQEFLEHHTSLIQRARKAPRRQS